MQKRVRLGMSTAVPARLFLSRQMPSGNIFVADPHPSSTLVLFVMQDRLGGV